MVSNPEKSESSEIEDTRRKPLVLIIDDHPEYAKLFELLADSLGITARLVKSCQEGIKALENDKFDVVLMDWLMPDVTGPECSCKIRKIEEGKADGGRVPIIGVSGSVLASRQACIDAGMDDYLPIPFTLPQLHDILAKWLPKQN